MTRTLPWWRSALELYQLFVEGTGRASTIVASNRDTAEWLVTFDDMMLAQSAVDRFKNAAYDLVVDGTSYRARLKPRSWADSALGGALQELLHHSVLRSYCGPSRSSTASARAGSAWLPVRSLVEHDAIAQHSPQQGDREHVSHLHDLPQIHHGRGVPGAALSMHLRV